MPVRSEQIPSPFRTSSVQQRGSDTTIELFNENSVTSIVLGGGSGLTALQLGSSGTTISIPGTLNMSSSTLNVGVLTGLSGVQGDVLYHNGTSWVRLGAGTSGFFLKTQGAAANPMWDSVAGGGGVAGPGASTDNAIARWNGTAGNAVQDSAVTVADTTGAMTWGDGGGAAVRIVGPTDQDFRIAAGGTTRALGLFTNSTERFRLDNTGILVFGDSYGSTVLADYSNLSYTNTSLMSIRSGTTQNMWRIFNYNATPGPAAIQGIASRGTYASPAALVSGDVCFTLVGSAQFSPTRTDYGGVANIQFVLDGTPGASDLPGRIVFNTVPDGSGTPVERLRIDNAGSHLIGWQGTTPAGAIGQVAIGTSATSSMMKLTDAHSTVGSAADLTFQRARGSLSSQSIVSSGDAVGQIFFQAWVGGGGDNMLGVASVEVFVDGTPGVNDAPGRIVFSTTLDGAATLTERMRINNIGTTFFGNGTLTNDDDFVGTSGSASIPIMAYRDTSCQIRQCAFNTTAANGTYWLGLRGRGTAATPANCASGDMVSSFYSLIATSATSTVPIAEIRTEVDGTPAINDGPGRILFLTTLDGAAALTERMRINNTGTTFLGDGTAGAALGAYSTGSAAVPLVAYRNGGTQITQLAFDATATTAPIFFGVRGRGTAASPTQTLSGDTLMRVTSGGFNNGPSIQTCAEIQFVAEETFTGSVSGSGIRFLTVLNTTATQTERMRIDNTGRTTAFGWIGASSASVTDFNTLLAAGYTVSNTLAFLVTEAGLPLRSFSYSSTAGNAAAIQGSRTRGTIASPAAVQVNDSIFVISARAASAANLTQDLEAGSIKFEVDAGTITAGTSMSSRIGFFTTPDGTNVATEKMRIRNDGMVIVGLPGGFAFATAGLTGANTSIQIQKDADNRLRHYVFAASGAPGIVHVRARGTGASPAAVQSGDTLGSFSCLGFGGTGAADERVATNIFSQADGATFTTSSSPGRIVFATTPSGSTTAVERARINNLGTMFSGDGTLASGITGISAGEGHAAYALNIYRNESCQINQFAFSATAGNGTAVRGVRGRGTAASPAATAANDLILNLSAYGFISTTQVHDFASIRMYVDGDVALNDSPGRIEFYTTPDGSGATVERWRIDNAGALSGRSAGSQLTWTTGLGAISHILGPTDQDLNLAAASARRVVANGQPIPVVLSTTTGVDLKTVGTTNLYTVPSGKSLIVVDVVVRPTTATAANGDAVAGVGVAAGEDDIFSSQTLTGLNATTERFKFPSSGISYVAQATEVVKFGVDTADTGTALVADVYLIGYLI